MKFDDALTWARSVSFAILGDKAGVQAVHAVGDLGRALSLNPPAENLKAISLLVVSGHLWAEFRDATGKLTEGLDCQPRTARFHAAREVLRYEYSTSAPIRVDPLAQFAASPTLWSGGRPETILDLYIVPSGWNMRGRGRYFARQICSSKLLTEFEAEAIPFIDGRFSIAVQRVQQTGEYL